METNAKSDQLDPHVGGRWMDPPLAPSAGTNPASTFILNSMHKRVLSYIVHGEFCFRIPGRPIKTEILGNGVPRNRRGFRIKKWVEAERISR